MKDLISQLQIQVNEKIFLKDPNSSELGRKIVRHGIELIDSIGFEKFTFRKLAVKIETSEASVYRYFESKHHLLVYILSWYWGWIEYKIVFATTNIQDPVEKLKSALSVLCIGADKESFFHHMNVKMLNRIMTSESSKAYLVKEVDEANKEGFYAGYKRVIARLSNILLEINVDYKFPHSLASTVVEGIYHQKYFSDHLPSLTDLNGKEESILAFYNDMILNCLQTQTSNK